MLTLFLYIKKPHDNFSENCGKIAAAERKNIFCGTSKFLKKFFVIHTYYNYITEMQGYLLYLRQYFDCNFGDPHLINRLFRSLYNS